MGSGVRHSWAGVSCHLLTGFETLDGLLSLSVPSFFIHKRKLIVSTMKVPWEKEVSRLEEGHRV